MNATNFTQIPNNFLDDKNLNPYQYMILAFIVRKTDGWCKTEDGISLSQFVNTLNISKNKVISSLKELKYMGYIEVKQQFLKNGGKSFNSYSISSTLVHEVNYPSASQGQGVVREKDIQNKLLTKETNTNKKINKKVSYTLPSSVDIELFSDYLNLRKTLKAPNTQRAIDGLIGKLNDFESKGLNANEIIATAYENGWKSFYAPKPQPRQHQPYNTPKSQTLNTDVNIWDEIEKQSNNKQEFIDG